MRLESMREQRKQKSSKESAQERETRLRRDNERKRDAHIGNIQNLNEIASRNQERINNSATIITEEEHLLLKNFRKKMSDIEYKMCPVCNERIPGMTLVKDMCRHYYTEKKSPKKFSAKNNMDPGDVSEELKGLTEIKEMLIAQIFTVMSVYQLREEQNGYRGNVINFPQNIQEFTNRLPRNPSSLEIFLVRR